MKDDIYKFIIDVLPALHDERNYMTLEQLCGLYNSERFVYRVIPSFVSDEMGISSAKYIEMLLRETNICKTYSYNRCIICLTTGEYREHLTDDEQSLCNCIMEDEAYESGDLIVATDSSLGKQSILRLVYFKSDTSLVQ